MKLTIVRDDNYMSVDGVVVQGINMSPMPEHVRVVQFDTVTGGHYERYDGINEDVGPSAYTELEPMIKAHEKARLDAEARERDPLYKLGSKAGRDKALATKLFEVEVAANAQQSESFVFEGHIYFAAADDIITMNGVLINSIGLDDTDPIPTPPPIAGSWLSADVDESGNRVAVPFTVGDFKRFTSLLYERNSLIWGKKLTHTTALNSLYASGVSGYKILEYSINW